MPAEAPSHAASQPRAPTVVRARAVERCATAPAAPAAPVGGSLSVSRLSNGFALASDPFSQGWDLFGTADDGIDYTVFPQEDTWYIQAPSS
jgi:hypothetical protein